jgi:hypothetical protein
MRAPDSPGGPTETATEDIVPAKPATEFFPGVDSVRVNEFLAALPAAARLEARRFFLSPKGESGGSWFSLQGNDELNSLARRALVGANRPTASSSDRFLAPSPSFDVWSRPVTLYLGRAGQAVSVTVRAPNPEVRGEDIVYLPGDRATPEYLSAALWSVARFRAQLANANSLDKGKGIRFRDLKSSSKLPSTWRAYLARKLDELQQSPFRETPNHGRVRALVIKKMGR